MRQWVSNSRCDQRPVLPTGWRSAAVAAIVFGALPSQGSARATHAKTPARPDVSHIRGIRSLSPEQAGSSLPVRLTGVVTALSGWKDSFFLQDGTTGVSVDRLDHAPKLHAGDRVVVNGTTAPGDFAPVVLSKGIQVIGTGSRPPARLRKAADLLDGTQDSQWMSLHGTVRSADVRPIWDRRVLVLNLDIGSNTIVKVHVQQYAEDAVERLAGAVITVRGVCGTIFNDRGQFMGLRLFASTLEDVTIEKKPPADPFAVPARSLWSQFQFGDAMRVVDQVKVTGVVSWSRAHEGFYLQDGVRAAFVEKPNGAYVPVGATVDVVGYPTHRRGLPSLRAAFVRVAPAAREPLRSSLHSAGDMIVMRDGFLSTPYDAQLVTMQGRLVDQVWGASTHSLVVQDGNQVFSAILPNSSTSAALELGSRVRVTGVCSAGLDETRDASSFEILLRTPEDVTVIQRPPWWNGTHALWLLGALTLVLCGVVIWAVVSRKRATLKALIVTDPLTSLYNRRGFELLARKQQEIARRRRDRHAALLPGSQSFQADQ